MKISKKRKDAVIIGLFKTIDCLQIKLQKHLMQETAFSKEYEPIAGLVKSLGYVIESLLKIDDLQEKSNKDNNCEALREQLESKLLRLAGNRQTPSDFTKSTL